jgi:hypothetical protein
LEIFSLHSKFSKPPFQQPKIQPLKQVFSTNWLKELVA